jgi:hypothetical protein
MICSLCVKDVLRDAESSRGCSPALILWRLCPALPCPAPVLPLPLLQLPAVLTVAAQKSSSISSLLHKTAAGCGCIMKPTSKPKHCRSGSKDSKDRDKDRDKEKEASDNDRARLVQQQRASHEQVGGVEVQLETATLSAANSSSSSSNNSSCGGGSCVVVAPAHVCVVGWRTVSGREQQQQRWRQQGVHGACRCCSNSS